jgi:hypothetical protein
MENCMLGPAEDYYPDFGPADGDEPDEPIEQCRECEQPMDAYGDLLSERRENHRLRLMVTYLEARVNHGVDENKRLRSQIESMEKAIGRLVAA